MARIVIIEDMRYLEDYLRRILPCTDNQYVVWGDNNGQAVGLLEDNGFRCAQGIVKDDTYNKKFLEEYIDLVGDLSCENNSRLWWATDIASKNRLTSKLPDLIQQFIGVMHVIRNTDAGCLIIFAPSWIILPSLKKTLRDQDIPFVSLGNRFKRWVSVWLYILRKVGAVFYSAALICFRSLYVRRTLKGRIKNKINPGQRHYVIKSFIYKDSFLENGHYQDTFFGCLPDYLKDKKNVLILANILGDFKYCVKKIKECATPLIVPIDNFITFTDIVQAVTDILFFKFKVKKNIAFQGYSVSDIIVHELRRTYKGIQLYQLLHYHCMQRLLNTISVKTFLMTYENQPWERMCTLAIKERNPRPVILGYQHAVVAQAHINLFLSLKEKNILPLPDRIFTIGEITQKVMEKYGHYDEGMLETSCALRYEYLSQSTVPKKEKSGKILVALGGAGEVYEMINYVLGQLRGHDHYEVLIRTHPLHPWHYFERKFHYNINSTPNFRISGNKDLREDIGWADIVIYWESTVGLEALSLGKPIIHFAKESILSYDPLPECHHLKWIVSPKDSLKSAIDEIYSLRDEQFLSEYQQTGKYLNRYFYPVVQENLCKFANPVAPLLRKKRNSVNPDKSRSSVVDDAQTARHGVFAKGY